MTAGMQRQAAEQAPVVTVTLNPAIDQTVIIDRLTPGAVHRARRVERNAGGKGVNVASCLADWGLAATVTGVLGQDNTASFDALFAAGGITDRFIRVPGATRVNIKLADLDSADTTDINLPGLDVDTGAIGRLMAVLDDVAGTGAIVVLAGSLPAGVDTDLYRVLTGYLRGRGARVVLDTSGPPLAAALDAPPEAMPDCVKPNRAELADWAGRPLDDDAAVVEAARALVRRGIGLVVVSMGADGALFVTAEDVIHAALPPERVLSTVGAGDAMVAGIVAAMAEGGAIEDLARRGVAFATAKLALVGPHLPPAPRVAALAAQVMLDHPLSPARLQA
ncbi:phosphofructokinase [Tistrella bauzanensis]|uniref:Phosphofructokinase n=2 Tax=Tistrella bauzanensis TaxID=657419 RepID=A0ABQ1IJA3_9PROT|nr:phosphofructokinase [Tistrella bauzanensis]